jgi:hypothetical protein
VKNNDDTCSNNTSDSDEEVNIDDEIGWTDADEAEQLFSVLAKNMKALKKSKRPLVNIGNSRTTKYRKKIKAIENRKKNGQTLFQLLKNQDNSDDDNLGDSSFGSFGSGSSDRFSSGISSGNSFSGVGFSGDNSSHNNNFSSVRSSGEVSLGDDNIIGSNSNNAKNTQLNTLINVIEDKLKIENNHLTPGYKLRLIAVQHYLQLLNKGHAKLEASQIVADLLNKGIWFARCVRSWAKEYIEYGDVPHSNRGKHLRESSILDDEDVQLKVASYLQQHKFDTTVHSFCDYIANEVLPSVGIEKRTKIRYLFYYIYIFLFNIYFIKNLYIYSKSTAIRWLKKMGFIFSQYTKGMYIDGHERDDVVAYRKNFLETMSR